MASLHRVLDTCGFSSAIGVPHFITGLPSRVKAFFDQKLFLIFKISFLSPPSSISTLCSWEDLNNAMSKPHRSRDRVTPRSKHALHHGHDRQGFLIAKTCKHVGSLESNHTGTSAALDLTLKLAAAPASNGAGEHGSPGGGRGGAPSDRQAPGRRVSVAPSITLTFWDSRRSRGLSEPLRLCKENGVGVHVVPAP